MASRKDIDWEAIQRDKRGLIPLQIDGDESGVMRILKNLAVTDRLFEALGIPEGIVEFEFPLPRGRADIVVFHHDGTATVIEAKGSRDFRGVLSGIGQVVMYAVQIGFSKATMGIRKILVAPYIGEDPEVLLIHNACQSAGVEFLPIGTLKEHQDISYDLICERYPEYIKGFQ